MSFGPKRCRVCTHWHKALDMAHIFHYHRFSKDYLEISKVITDCASVQIDKDDEYSHTICKYCLNLLCQAYSFKRLCEESDNKMRMTKIGFKKIAIKPASEETNNDFNIIEDNTPEDTESHEIKIEVKSEPLDFSTNIEFCEIKTELIEDQTKNLEQQPQEEIKQFNVVLQKLPETDRFKCDLCNIIFNKAESLNIHRKIHTKCDICFQSFKLMKDLQKHRATHFIPNPLISKIPPQLNKAPKTKSPLIRFKCDICNVLCRNISQLYQHRATHVPTSLADDPDSGDVSPAPKVKYKKINFI